MTNKFKCNHYAIGGGKMKERRLEPSEREERSWEDIEAERDYLEDKAYEDYIDEQMEHGVFARVHIQSQKRLYRAQGKYKYNNCWNEIPKECEYFYAFSNTKTWVLKNLIARHRGLSDGQASYVFFDKKNINEVRANE